MKDDNDGTVPDGVPGLKLLLSVVNSVSVTPGRPRVHGDHGARAGNARVREPIIKGS